MPSLARLPASPLALAAALSLAACAAVGPDYQPPKLALTPAFQAAVPTGAGERAPLVSWWEGFHDPALTRVVERAGAQNLDIAQARARVLQSRALARAAGAALAPRGDFSGSAANEEQSLESPIGEIGRRLPGYQRTVDEYALGAGASWEIDLFGGLRRQRQGALADARAAEDEAAAIRIAVMADAADAYIQVRANQARLAVARRQEAIQGDLVDLLTRRGVEGVASDRERREGLAQLEGVRATLPPLTAALDAQLNRLDVLMGAQPGTWRAELSDPAPPPAPPTLAAGDGPAALLRRRPDILAAEQRLIAANARIGAAVADYYPKVSIAGLIGVDSIDAGHLFVADALQHQVTAGLQWRLFDFGRVDAEVARARGGEAQALAAYRATVLRAVEEVEDAFTRLTEDKAQAGALDRQVEQLDVARRQATQAYAEGVLSLIELRDADRDLQTASDQRVQARAGAALAAVAAFRAMGGGWRAPGALAFQTSPGARAFKERAWTGPASSSASRP
jgi:NodT family efflux transporter outer membrane factor (OMF) lipoprotein